MISGHTYMLTLHICLLAYKYACMSAYMLAYIYADIHICQYTYMLTYTYADIHICLHTHMPTYMLTYTYMLACSYDWSVFTSLAFSTFYVYCVFYINIPIHNPRFIAIRGKPLASGLWACIKGQYMKVPFKSVFILYNDICKKILYYVFDSALTKVLFI